MDFGIIGGVDPPDPSAGPMPYAAVEPARFAMGDTLRYANRVSLVDMQPRGDLSSTGYALANPGEEYLVLEASGTPFTVTLEAGTYAVEWFSVEGRERFEGDETTVDSTIATTFTTPFDPAGPAVLYLKAG